MVRILLKAFRYVSCVSLMSALFALPMFVYAGPSVFPTGTTIYDPAKAWNGYTLHDIPNQGGAILVDMNGNPVKR